MHMDVHMHAYVAILVLEYLLSNVEAHGLTLRGRKAPMTTLLCLWVAGPNNKTCMCLSPYPLSSRFGSHISGPIPRGPAIVPD